MLPFTKLIPSLHIICTFIFVAVSAAATSSFIERVVGGVPESVPSKIIWKVKEPSADATPKFTHGVDPPGESLASVIKGIATHCALLIPAAPVAPVPPAAPELPVNPVSPLIPCIPVSPLAPANPASPLLPSTPLVPALPVSPFAPTVPLVPAAPAKPVAPVHL